MRSRSKVPRRATYEEANLLLRLYELRREERLRKAREWFIKNFHASTMEEFQKLCPLNSEENAFYRMVVSYWDMAASFVAGGVLHEGYSRRTPASCRWFGSGFTTSYRRCAKPSRTQTSPEAWKQLRTRWSRIGSQILRLGFNGRRSSRRHTNTGLNAPGE
jgi:hypothetical protein